MIEFLIVGLFSILILLWLVSQPTPSHIYDKRFKKMIEEEINFFEHVKERMGMK